MPQLIEYETVSVNIRYLFWHFNENFLIEQFDALKLTDEFESELISGQK